LKFCSFFSRRLHFLVFFTIFLHFSQCQQSFLLTDPKGQEPDALQTPGLGYPAATSTTQNVQRQDKAVVQGNPVSGQVAAMKPKRRQELRLNCASGRDPQTSSGEQL
jgi:hypothetical protein